jgi:DNA polymerase-1
MFDWGPEAKYGIQIAIDQDERLGDLSDLCALDVENEQDGGFAGLSLYDGRDTVFYFSRLSAGLKSALESRRFITHSGNTDLHKLKSWGVNVTREQNAIDIHVSYHVLNNKAKRLALKELAKEHLGIEYPSFEDICGKGKKRLTWAEIPLELKASYNCMDSICTWKLAPAGQKTLPYDYAYAQRFNRLLFDLEEKGILIDTPKLVQLQAEVTTALAETTTQLATVLGPINLNSPKQLLEALQSKLDITPKYRNKLSTDKRALERFSSNPTIQMLMKRSELATLLESFLGPLIERNESVLHPWFKAWGTHTGRLSCANPNVQQIPRKTALGKKIREAFIAPPGQVLWCADFGQVEPRIMAHMSKNKAMQDMFHSGIDFHQSTAQKMSIDREAAKVLNLSVSYRATRYSVSQQLKCNPWQAESTIQKWWKVFPGLNDWQLMTIEQARSKGFVETLLGRVLHFEKVESPNDERMVINNLVQGSALDVLMLAMFALDKVGADMRATVHDEVLGYTTDPTLIDVYQDAMESCINLDVPLAVEINYGLNWAAAKQKPQQ